LLAGIPINFQNSVDKTGGCPFSSARRTMNNTFANLKTATAKSAMVHQDQAIWPCRLPAFGNVEVIF